MSINSGIKVGIDTTLLLTNADLKSQCFVNSIYVYMTEILDGMCETGHAGQITLFTYQWAEEHFRSRYPGVRIVCAGNKPGDLFNRVTGKNIYAKLNMDANIIRTINACDVDVVWNPFVNQWRGNVKHKFLETLIDLTEYRDRTYKRNEFRESFRKEAQAADHIVTQTEHVKRDIMETFSLPGDRITAIPCAVEEPTIHQEKVEGVEPGFILNVNAYREHKNQLTLIRAFDRIRDQFPGGLVLCGGGINDAYYERILQEIAGRHLEKRVHLYHTLPKPQISWLYRHAVLFVNTSLLEGFGRTPIEASLTQTPVLTTRESCLYETTLGLVEYVSDPMDDKEYADSMLRILKDGVSYDLQKVKEAYQKEYSPASVAGRYWDAFEHLAAPGQEKTGSVF